MVLLCVIVALALPGIGCSPSLEPASKDAPGEPLAEEQPADTATANNSVSIEARRQFAAASQQLHRTLATLGYDTAEGDHSGLSSEVFLAVPKSGGASIRVSASWGVDQPQGSFDQLGVADVGGAALPQISRASAKGIWFQCNGLLLELLSNAGVDAVRELVPSIRKRMRC